MLSSNSFFSIIQTILILLIVILLANISLRFLNKKMSQNQKMIKIIERVNLSNNSALGIVLICGKYYLMSFTEKDNKILKELDEGEIEDYLEDFNDQYSYEDLKDKAHLFFGMRKRD